MPQIGNKCPGIAEYHTFSSGFCLRECQRQCIPPSVLVHIENKQRVDKHQGHYISVTALLGCMRQLYLEREIEYYVEPPLNWYSVRGTLLHNILEQPTVAGDVDSLGHKIQRMLKRGELQNAEENKANWEAAKKLLEKIAADAPGETIPDWQSETEYEYPLGYYSCQHNHVWQRDYDPNTIDVKCPTCGDDHVQPWFLKGTIDVLRPESGEVWDYKTIGDRGLGIVRRGAKKEHVMQFNAYRFLAERGYPVGMTPADYTPIKINKIRAYYMTMMQCVGTGTLLTEDSMYRVSDPEFEHGEVGRELLEVKSEMVLKKGKRKATAKPEDYVESVKKKWRMTYAVPDVELMPLGDVEAFIKGAAPTLIQAFVNGTMPDMCAPEMRAWKCQRFCPEAVRNACDAYNETVGVKRMKEAVPETDDDLVVEGP